MKYAKRADQVEAPEVLKVGAQVGSLETEIFAPRASACAFEAGLAQVNADHLHVREAFGQGSRDGPSSASCIQNPPRLCRQVGPENRAPLARQTPAGRGKRIALVHRDDVAR